MSSKIIQKSETSVTRSFVLSVCLNYSNYSELFGCVTDGIKYCEFLKKKHNIPNKHVFLLRDDIANTNKNYANYDNFISTLKTITGMMLQGDILYFHFSGHSGFTYGILPSRSIILADKVLDSDTLYSALTLNIPKMCHLVCLLDCVLERSLFNLKICCKCVTQEKKIFVYKNTDCKQSDNNLKMYVLYGQLYNPSKTPDGEIIVSITPPKIFSGAMTSSLLASEEFEHFKQGKEHVFKYPKIKRNSCFVTLKKVGGYLEKNDYSQVPVLMLSSETMNLDFESFV